MPFELIREYITLDQEVNAIVTQTSLEEIIKIPDFKPNMRSILSVNGDVIITSQIIEGSLLNIEGNVEYKVFYVAEGGYLDCAQVMSPFNYSLQLKDAEGDVECLVKAHLEHVDFRITNSRKLSVRCVMKIEGKAIKRINFPSLVDVREMSNVQKLQHKIPVTKSYVKEDERLSVNDKVVIDENDETALRLIDTRLGFEELKSNKSPSGVLITGKVRVDTVYSVDLEEVREYKKISNTINFSQFIEKYGVETVDDYFFNIDAKNRNIDFTFDTESETMYLSYDIDLHTDIAFYENIEVENIQDLYSPEVKSKVEKDEIKTYYLAGEFREEIEIDDEDLLSTEMPVEEVYVSNVKATVTYFDISEGQLNVEGLLKVDLILDEAELMESHQKEIPFSCKKDISTQDIKLNDVDIFVDNIEVTIKGNALSAKAGINLRGNLIREVTLNLINSVEELENRAEEVQGEYYTVKAHYKQPNETLWEIAKENSTTIEKILEDNHLESEESLKDYMPLILE